MCARIVGLSVRVLAYQARMSAGVIAVNGRVPNARQQLTRQDAAVVGLGAGLVPQIVDRSGADLRYVQKTMGHSTPTVTANIYSDLYADELDTVAMNLDRLGAPNLASWDGHRPDTPTHQ